MRLQTVGVSRTTVDARMVYGADTRFGRAAHVGPRLFMGGAMAIMVVGFIVRVWHLGVASLWTDEAMTAYRAQAPFKQSLQSIMAAGNQSPLYFWSLRLFPNSTETLLRLPSALLGMAGIALFMLIVVKLYRDREVALWAGALLAVNPFHVWLSRTARPYAMLFVAGLLASYFFLMLLRGRRSRAIWVGFTLTSMVAYATHFTAVALPAAQYIMFAFMLRDQYKLFRRWIMAQAIAAVPALCWVYIVLRQPLGIASEWIPRPQLRDIPLTLWNLTLGYDGVFKWIMVPGLVIVTLGLVFGMSYAVDERKKNRREFYWFWLILAAIIPVFVASSTVISIYVDRYFTVLLPAILLLTIQGWMLFSRQLFRMAMVIVIATGVWTILFTFYHGSYRRDDWRNVAAYVGDRYQPGDTILLERDNTVEVFTHYYNQDLTAPQNPSIVMLSETPDTSSMERSSQRIWVVYRNPNEDVHRMGEMPDFNPFNPKLAKMGEWLSTRESQLVEQRSFNGVKILLIDPQRAQVRQ